jgi:hypothetical protein
MHMTLSTSILKGLLLAAVVGGTANAQSITGKWARKSIKMTAIEKASGKRQDISETSRQMVEMYKETIEFKPDHTFLMSTRMLHAAKPVEMYGTYKLTGNQLSLELDPKLVAEWKKLGESLKKMSKQYAAESAKAEDPNNKLPRSVTVKSVNGATMVWFYSGDAMIGDEEMKKKYSMEQEVTYQKL